MGTLRPYEWASTQNKDLERISTWAVVMHTFTPCLQEAETGSSLSSRASWSTDKVPGQPGLHRETPSSKRKQKKSIS